MNIDVLTTRVADGIAVITLGSATETPLAQGLALERNLFLKLCVSESALARMRSYEGKKIISPSHVSRSKRGTIYG